MGRNLPAADASRPDPDQLLARVERDEARAGRGRLRIYFGASAGVGKTYAMLTEGLKQRAEGRDVVVGIIETHGRSETAALMGDGKNLEVLPPREIEYRDRKLPEFDLDGALARHPSLLLVDELAHSNVPGSRHPKRWQDVDELLVAGIDVYTALNVQHLETLNDVVGGITGVRVQETVPDTFFDSANEVILVDLPAEELLKRLDAGKVYVPEEARRAAKNFFRRGNLMALRELALRRTADRLEGDVQSYRSDEAILPVWKTGASLLCCVGPGVGDEHVVRATARLAKESNTAWHAAYVETPSLQRLPEAQRERILRNVRLAQALGAKTAILSDNDVPGRIIDYARIHNLSKIVLGRPPRASRWPWRAPLALRLSALATDVDLIEIGRAVSVAEAPLVRTAASASDDEGRPHARDPRLNRQYIYATLSCVVATALALPVSPWLGLTNLAMLFVLVVALVAMRFGRGPAMVSAALNVLAYDFFFVPPKLSFAVSDLQYLVTFAVMFIIALIIGELSARLRYQVRVATHREERARELYEFARDLSSGLRSDDVIEISRTVVGRAFRGDVEILAAGRARQLDIPEDMRCLPDFEPAIAQWAFDKQLPAGLGTATLPGSRWLYLPLRAPAYTRGVLALKPRNRRLLMVPEQIRQLETFAVLVAIALERVHYVEVAQEALVGMESERLRNSLLSALSHDLRTPLAVLIGLADSLTLTRPNLSSQQGELALAIRDEARRMNALVTNLLDMARIETGGIRLNLQWQPLEEVVGSALRATRAALENHRVEIRLDADLPLVQFDATLIERVLVNLLENAAKYTPSGTTVAIAAATQGAELVVSVDDNGPGLPRGREEELFAKFARGEKESATPGVGLGLAICRAIVEAHGGRMRADPSRKAGARLFFTLPLGHPPVVAEEDAESAAHV